MSGYRLGLIGDPVEHSLSPRMHAAAFEALGLDAEYVLRPVPGTDRDAVAAAMEELAGSGGGNVTLPHKGRAARALDHATEAVRRTGACNCFWRDEAGALIGDNTDVSAVEGVLAEWLGGREPADVLILGAGGAAAAVAVAAGALSADSIRLANRTPARARRLVGRLRGIGLPARVEPWPVAGTCEVIVNATSLGLSADDPPPASFDRITARLALDMVYVGTRRGDGETAWVDAARSRGIDAVGGLEILVRQGAACYPRWFGLEGPLEALRRGVGMPGENPGSPAEL